MTTPSLKSSRERDDHRPDGDNTACFRSASYWALKASSISSGQGGRTRLFSFFMTFSRTEGQPPSPSERANGAQRNIAHANQAQPDRATAASPHTANRLTAGSSHDREGNSKTGAACLDVQTMQRDSPTGVTRTASRVFIVE